MPDLHLSSTGGGQNVPTDLISFALPGLKQMADIVQMSPGLTATDGFKPGAIGLNARIRFNTYGINSGNTNVTVMVDGFKIIANSVPDLANTEEVDVEDVRQRSGGEGSRRGDQHGDQVRRKRVSWPL